MTDRRLVALFVGMVAALVAVPVVFDTLEWAAEKSSGPPHVARPAADVTQEVLFPSIEELTAMIPTTTTTTSLPAPDPVPATVPPTSTAQAPLPPASLVRDVGGFLACVRAHESGGDYTAVSSDGLYHGAYQFLQSSWDSTARHAGRDDLVGVAPELVSPADQDAMAAALYEWQGSSPWNGSGC